MVNQEHFRGPMDKNNGAGRIECKRWGVSSAEECTGEKIRATVIEQQ